MPWSRERCSSVVVLAAAAWALGVYESIRILVTRHIVGKGSRYAPPHHQHFLSAYGEEITDHGNQAQWQTKATPRLNAFINVSYIRF